MKITIKRVGAVLLAVLVVVSAAVGVSAEDKYLTLTDYGLGVCSYSSSGISNISYIDGAGSTFTFNKKGYGFAFWEFDLDKDFTYTCSFSAQFTNTSPAYIEFSPESVFYGAVKSAFISSTSSNIIYDFSYTKVSYNVWDVAITVSFNPTVCDIASSSIAIYAAFKSSGFKETDTYTTNGWGVSCKYDPGGSYYEKAYAEYLDRIINAGSGYPLPDDAASSLDSGVSSINSAEGALTGKSSSLMDSVATEWTANKNTAKTFLTTVQPTAVQIKNFYTTLTAAMPDEVLALFAIIPLLLFIGYLLGRVK